MHSKRTVLIALAMLVLLLPFSTGIASAVSPQSQPSQAVGLQLTGMVVDAGSQTYQLSGGQLMSGLVFGIPITSGFLYYQMYAQVSGLSTRGSLLLVISAQTPDGGNLWVSASGPINESVPAVGLPLGCQNPDGTLGSSCTSEIPAMFVGFDNVFASVDGEQMQIPVLPIGIESAYLNPFGGPIVLTSMEPELTGASQMISIVATYSTATIQWRNVLMEGTATGTFGNSQVSGAFSMNVRSFENLVSGVEHDQGQIVLSGVTPNGIPAVGRFHGVSTIPQPQAAEQSACASMMPGTCSVTGLTSAGSLVLQSGNIHITGMYQTFWVAPAVGFTSFVSATATSGHHTSDGN